MLFFKKKKEKLVDEKDAIKNFAEVRTQMEKGDFKAMVTEGSPLNIKWTSEVLDKIADRLTVLRDNGVVVLWRPFHEMNGNWFWWHPREASVEDFKGIWVQMYKYFTETRKLDNLLWVYCPNHYYVGSGIHRPAYYYPGSEYVDIVAPDWYTNTADDLGGYEELVALGKPFGIAECGPKESGMGNYDNLSMVRVLTETTWRSAFFCNWSSPWAIIRNHNAAELMTHPKAITRDKISW
jgi:mannan endo-1,4-beta-mannosidase